MTNPPISPDARLRPVCICTDAGYDADDWLALLIAAAALPLRLVVTSDEFGGGQRARLVRRLLDLMGRTGVVVLAGAELPGAQARWVCDGLAPDDAPPIPSSIEALADAVSTVLEGSDRAEWIGQGPLTNLAQLREFAPELTRRLVITLMGGGLSSLYRDPSRASHNARMDPQSARAIWTAPDLDLRLVTSDITFTTETEITRESEVYQLLAAHNAPRWAQLIAAGYDRWFSHRRGGGSKAADALAVAAAAGLSCLEFDTMRVAIGADARMSLDPNGIDLCMSTRADYPAFRGWTTMVVRHALESGMGYDPGLTTRLPGAPAALGQWS